MSAGRVMHIEASQVDARWLGRDVMVVDSQTGAMVYGALSDVEQHPTTHRTLLWLGGHPMVDARGDATITVTVDTLGAIGGAVA